MTRVEIESLVRSFIEQNPVRAFITPRIVGIDTFKWNLNAVERLVDFVSRTLTAAAVDAFDPEAAAATRTSSKITPAPSVAPASMPAYLAGSYRALCEVLAEEITERKAQEKRATLAAITSDCWRDVVVTLADTLGLGFEIAKDFTEADQSCGGLVENFNVVIGALKREKTFAGRIVAAIGPIVEIMERENRLLKVGDHVSEHVLPFVQWLVQERDKFKGEALANSVRAENGKTAEADLSRMFEGLKPVRAIMEKNGIAANDAGNIEELAPFIAGLVATAENAKQLDLRNQNQASTIGNLQGRVIDLSNALAPFAVAAVHWDLHDKTAHDSQYVHTNPLGSITVGDLRTARNVYTGATRKTPAAVAKSECVECGIVVEPGTVCVLARCPGRRA